MYPEEFASTGDDDTSSGDTSVHRKKRKRKRSPSPSPSRYALFGHCVCWIDNHYSSIQYYLIPHSCYYLACAHMHMADHIQM